MRKRIWALVAAVGIGAALLGSAAHASTAGTYVDPPTNVHATTNASGYPVVTWDASRTDAAVVGEYEIFPASGPATLAGGASTHNGVTSVTITNLAPGTYTFHVRAVINTASGILKSDFSAPSNAVVNAPPPPLFTPLQVHATASDASARVYWVMPNGVTHETNFQILVSPAGGTAYTVLTPAVVTAATLSFTVSGLTNGTQYTFEVRGEDTNIDPPLFSAWSLPSPPVAPHATVTMPTLTVGDVHVVRPPHKRFTISVPVYFSTTTTGPVTIVWHVVPGTATATRDYFDPGVVTTVVPAGSRSVLLPIDLRPHTAITGTRVFTVAITSATGATIADGSATVTLTRR